jgi:hypothetical protein
LAKLEDTIDELELEVGPLVFFDLTLKPDGSNAKAVQETKQKVTAAIDTSNSTLAPYLLSYTHSYFGPFRPSRSSPTVARMSLGSATSSNRRFRNVS